MTALYLKAYLILQPTRQLTRFKFIQICQMIGLCSAGEVSHVAVTDDTTRFGRVLQEVSPSLVTSEVEVPIEKEQMRACISALPYSD